MKTSIDDRPARAASSGASVPQVALQTRGLKKVFTDFWRRPRVTAVDGLDLRLDRGEVLGLLGPNGSGKSTTIKILLGLLFPTAGEVTVLRRDPRDVATKARIGFLPEETHLYRYLDARETLIFFGRLFGLDRATCRSRANELLELVGLKDVGSRPVGEFSKGMQRRVALAQALVNDPELLILDEPTSGLDPLGTRQVKDLVLDLRSRGTAILLSSHLLADVEDVCDRVAILYAGRKLAEGSCDELLARGERTRIEIEALPGDVLERLRRWLQDEAGVGDLRVETPRQRLESFFLDLVQEAQAPPAPPASETPASAEASAGARSGPPPGPAGS